MQKEQKWHQGQNGHFTLKWKIKFLKSLMNSKHQRSNSKIFMIWDCFERAWNEKSEEGHFKIILEKVHFWQFWLRGIFWNRVKIVCFLKKAIFQKIVFDFQSLKTSLRTPQNDIVCPSKDVVKVVIQKSYFD